MYIINNIFQLVNWGLENKFVIKQIKLMIDAETMMNNDSLDMEELAKHEVQYEEKDLQNEDKVLKIIQRYKNRINDLHKVIQHQKKLNDGLKLQLKGLNNQLNGVLEKISHRSQPAQKKHSKDQTIRKELENEIKKNQMQQKEISQLRAKVKTFDSQKISEMYNQLKEKQTKIQELNEKVKTLQKSQKIQKNMDIYKKEEQLNQKVSSLNEEIIHLKNKLEKQKKHEEVLNKSIKAQHQQILNLETKPKKAEKHDHKSDSDRKQGKDIIEEFSKLKQNYQNLQVTKKAAEKHLRHELDIHKLKIKGLEKQLDEAYGTIKRKDKEANIMSMKMKQTQRKNFNTLQPVERGRNSEDLGTGSGLFDQRKQFKGLMHIQGNYRKFDDTQSLTLQKNYRIKQFVFTWFEEHILSLDTIYQLRDGTEKQVSSFKLSHSYKNIKHGELALTDFQYIKDIEIYCGKFIEFMRIRTSREKILEVGNEKNCFKCKKSTFDIRSHEKPIAFLGAIDNKKVVGTQKGSEFLISFGLQIKKKEVHGKTRFNFGRTDSLQKYGSKKGLHNGKNDKNIIDQQ